MTRVVGIVSREAPVAGEKAACLGVLSDDHLRLLVRGMLRRVLSALRNARSIERSFVVTADSELAQLAAEHGAEHIPEVCPEGLNTAVNKAARHVESLRADAMLVLPGDIPFVTGPEIDAFVSRVQDSGVALIAAHDRNGTKCQCCSHRPALSRRPLAGRVFANTKRRRRELASDRSDI